MQQCLHDHASSETNKQNTQHKLFCFCFLSKTMLQWRSVVIIPINFIEQGILFFFLITNQCEDQGRNTPLKTNTFWETAGKYWSISTQLFEILPVLSKISLQQRGSKVILTENLAGKYWGLFKKMQKKKRHNRYFFSQWKPDEKHN